MQASRAGDLLTLLLSETRIWDFISMDDSPVVWLCHTFFIYGSLSLCVCSSSFVIEFKDDGPSHSEQQHKLLSEGKRSPVTDSDRSASPFSGSASSKLVEGVSRGGQDDPAVVDGCFRQALVGCRDSLSTDDSQSTQDKEEQRGGL